MRIVKFFLHVPQKEQGRRLLARLASKHKQWKIGEEDLHNFENRAAYAEAINEMLLRTSTKVLPWQVIAADHKWVARVEVLRITVEALEKDMDLHSPARDKAWLDAARRRLG